MSLWEFQAAVGGWAKANSAEDTGAISREEAELLAESLDKPPIWH